MSSVQPEAPIVQQALDETYRIMRAAAVVAFSRMPVPDLPLPIPPVDEIPPSPDWPISKEVFDWVVNNPLDLHNGQHPPNGPKIHDSYWSMLDPDAPPPPADSGRPIPGPGNWTSFGHRALAAAAATGALAAMFAIRRGESVVNAEDLNDGFVIARANCKAITVKWYFCD